MRVCCRFTHSILQIASFNPIIPIKASTSPSRGTCTPAFLTRIHLGHYKIVYNINWILTSFNGIIFCIEIIWISCNSIQQLIWILNVSYEHFVKNYEKFESMVYLKNLEYLRMYFLMSVNSSLSFRLF